MAYRRLLLKLSGEALMGEQGYGLAPDVLAEVGRELTAAAAAGAQIGVVVGGGNIFRGVSSQAANMDRVKADFMGMLATVMNALALGEAVKSAGGRAEVMSGAPIGRFVEPFDAFRAREMLSAGMVIIFAAGTGLPYFTTDTAAALRAVEIEAEALFKATKVDGVYDDDPAKNPAARRYDRLTYDQVIVDNLRVMDQTAISFCRDNRLPILVFKLAPGVLEKALADPGVGTLID